jgi:hypothetical protein
MSSPGAAAFREELHGEQRATGLGLDQHVGLGVLDAALTAMITVHLVVNSPENDRVLTLVTKTGLFFRGSNCADVEIQLGTEANALQPGLDFEEIEIPTALLAVTLPHNRAGDVMVGMGI